MCLLTELWGLPGIDSPQERSQSASVLCRNFLSSSFFLLLLFYFFSFVIDNTTLSPQLSEIFPFLKSKCQASCISQQDLPGDCRLPPGFVALFPQPCPPVLPNSLFQEHTHYSPSEKLSQKICLVRKRELTQAKAWCRNVQVLLESASYFFFCFE